jgi:stage V sporulation protein B
MRSIGISFNVYITSKLGATGMGLLTLITTVYSLAITFATSGINLGTSRLVAEAMGHDSDKEIKSAMKCCIKYCLCFSIAACLILFFSADFIGNVILNDKRTILPLKILSCTLPLIALSSTFHGYFTAVRRAYKGALEQIAEQFIKIFFTVMGFILLMPDGIEYACIAIVLGSLVSEIFSFLTLFILYKVDIYKHNTNKGNILENLSKKLIGISVPVALSAYVRSSLVTIEHLLIPYGLKKYGASSDDSLATYGVIHGMVFPIILFPQALLGAFTGLLIPELADFRARKDNEHINFIVNRTFQLALCYAVGVAGIMICYSYDLGNILYHNNEATLYIRMVAPLIPIMYLDNATDCMLKGLNQQLYSMKVNIFDAVLSTILVYFMLPATGISGYIVIIFITEILNTAFSINRLLSISELKIKFLQWVVKPLFCIIGATACVNLFFLFSHVYIGNDLLSLIVNITATAALYILFLRITLSVTKDDIHWMRKLIKN